MHGPADISADAVGKRPVNECSLDRRAGTEDVARISFTVSEQHLMTQDLENFFDAVGEINVIVDNEDLHRNGSLGRETVIVAPTCPSPLDIHVHRLIQP